MQDKMSVYYKGFHFDNVYWNDPQYYDYITLYQIGDLCCEPGFCLSEHKQQCYEITYVVSGKGWFDADGVRYYVSQGDVIVNLPEQMHAGGSDVHDPFRYFYLGFDFNIQPKKVNPLLHIKKMLDKVQVPKIKDRFNLNIPFTQILGEIAEPSEYSNMMIENYLLQILVLTYRNFFLKWEKRYSPGAELNEKDKIIYAVIRYIDNNLLDIFELKEVGNALGYSYSYLSRIFSNETGLTIQSYYTKKKMEKAMELLRLREFSITQIAYELGYQSIHSFSKAFKRVIGVSPMQYQQLIK